MLIRENNFLLWFLITKNKLKSHPLFLPNTQDALLRISLRTHPCQHYNYSASKFLHFVYKICARWGEIVQTNMFPPPFTVLEPEVMTGERFRTDEKRCCFTQHIISLWNALPQDVVMATSIDGFIKGLGSSPIRTNSDGTSKPLVLVLQRCWCCWCKASPALAVNTYCLEAAKQSWQSLSTGVASAALILGGGEGWNWAGDLWSRGGTSSGLHHLIVSTVLDQLNMWWRLEKTTGSSACLPGEFGWAFPSAEEPLAAAWLPLDSAVAVWLPLHHGTQFRIGLPNNYMKEGLSVAAVLHPRSTAVSLWIPVEETMVGEKYAFLYCLS